jgi:hypothetical protein
MPGRRQDFQSNPNRHKLASNATPRRCRPAMASASIRDLTISEQLRRRYCLQTGDQRARCQQDVSQAQRWHNL